ncbi:hypothetical protein Tco_1092546 [Tanacetum coccineum]|uniref:Uncharacterized protein n=1 Tax=Tanacetum coccineum TaxID=301880 RepID=A0ABQ5ICD6_9ASTR
MDTNSSLGKICLGEDVIVISSDKVEGSGDWNSLEFQDTANSREKKETKAMVFFTKWILKKLVIDSWLLVLSMGWKLMMVVKKELIVALRGEIYFVKFIINPEEDDVEPRVILERSFLRMTKAVTDFEAGIVTIYHDIDPFLEETKEEEKSNGDWDKLLDFNIDDVPLLGEEGLPPFVCKMGKSSRNKKRAMENFNFFNQDIETSSSAGGHLTQEEAAKEALTIRISQKFALLEEERPIIETMAYHDKYKQIIDEVWKDKVDLDGNIIYEQLGREDMKKVDRGITMINHTQAEAMGILTNAVGFLGSLPVPLKQVNWKPDYKDSYSKEEEATGQWQTKTMGTHDDEAGSSRSKRSRQHETVEEVLLPQVHHEFLLWEGCNRDAKSRMDCDGEIDDMLRIRLREAGSDEEIFTLVAWIRAFNINEPIYAELCHEFYSTYEFDEVCADDELQTKKIIKFRLGGRAHSLTLLEFARRLGLYQAVELEEEGFNVYFEGGLRSDEHFNAQDYWTTGYDKVRKNDMWLLILFMLHTKMCRVLTEDVVRSLSAPIYCRDLDTITLRDLINFEGKLIPEDPQPGVPRVGIPRPLRASMQDLYDRMGKMEIRQEAIERMEYKQSYHWDRCQGVFEHMAGVYSVPLQGAYNPPGYAQPQYDQYYQQYPPPPPQYPPQYQQQQQDDDE